MLCLLLEHQGIAMTRDAIMDGVWGQEFSRENRTLDVHVRTLRTNWGRQATILKPSEGSGTKLVARHDGKIFRSCFLVGLAIMVL